MEIKKGGKRLGAGRKPFGKKKDPITAYVEKEVILEFGDKDKARDFIYVAFENRDKIKECLSLKEYDVPKTEPVAHEETNQRQEPKANYFAPESKQPAIISKRQQYSIDLNECRNYEDIKKVMLRAKADTMSGADRQIIDMNCKNIMDEKGIEAY
ncbi:MAG: hypothetical protein ABI091_05290 [Ferruginibacter sp.]